MKKSHIVYTRFANAKKALCSASSKGKAEVMAAAQEFGLAKDEYDNLPPRAGILGGKSRRRKTRGRRRKTRGGDDEKPGYRDTNPRGSPDSRKARQRVVDEATAKRQAGLASTAAVGGPLSTIREDGENPLSTTTVKSKEAPRPLVSSLFDKKGARRRITRRR
jgi:hypothetical protein